MHIMKGQQAAAIYGAMEDGTAKKIPSACFTDQCGDRIEIDFYQCGGRIFRCEHDSMDIETRLEVLDEEDELLFREFHHLQ